MTAALHPERILRQLNEQWEQLGKQQAGSGGVLRACAMTLIVVARDEADAGRARETVALLMHEHPSRAIIIRGRGEEALDARVFAECWRPMGRAQQICSEGIEILPGPGGMEEVARFLVPLRAPDLPVVVWLRGSGPDGAQGAAALFPLAGKLLFDTSTEPDADGALRALRRLHAHGYRVADLHWTRLTGWREGIAHLFDDGARADRIRSVRVTYGGGSVTTCARYMEAWLRSSLPLARVGIAPEPAEPGLHSVVLTGSEGGFSITRQGHMLEVVAPGRRYSTALPPSDEAALMREELSILGPDPVYERVLSA